MADPALNTVFAISSKDGSGDINRQNPCLTGIFTLHSVQIVEAESAPARLVVKTPSGEKTEFVKNMAEAFPGLKMDEIK